MAKNGMRIWTAIALVLVAAVLAQAKAGPSGGEGRQGASGQRASGTVVAADTLSESSQRRAMAFSLIARQRLDSGDSETAIVALQRSLQNDPNRAPTYFQLGMALKTHGALPLAIRVLRSYIRLGEDEDRLHRAQQIIRDLGVEPPRTPAEAVRESSYIGAEACGVCHPGKYEGFSKAAHNLTSRLATAASVDGSFAAEDATMWTRNPNLWFEMTSRPEAYYQTANTWIDNDLRQRSERMDIVIGSGKIGQSYLYWRGDRLFQLPVSYYAATDKWINSPGYPDGEAIFERPITARCLECHSTFFQSVAHGKNIHGRGAFMLGISCERCHGPGGEHAEFQRLNSEAGVAPHIVHPGKLAPQRLIEVCGQCHSSADDPHQPPFAFRPGDVLSDHFTVEKKREAEAAKGGGVHTANQVSRLAKSRCFQESEAMTCITCHDPHALERGNTSLFSSRCINCHEVEACAMEPEVGETIRDNCIDCHMPRRRAQRTQIQSASGLESPLMPEHYIAIYKDATERFLASVLDK